MTPVYTCLKLVDGKATDIDRDVGRNMIKNRVTPKFNRIALRRCAVR